MGASEGADGGVGMGATGGADSGVGMGATGDAGTRNVASPSIGIDLLEIERLERALERRPALAERLFTDSERAYAAARGRPGRHLAARFCAKEAVAKALELSGWSFREVEVVVEEGPPRVRLSGSAAERAAALGVAVAVSLTHSKGHAAAVAIAA